MFRACPTKELYRLAHDRITDLHQLNNIIQVWSSVDLRPQYDKCGYLHSKFENEAVHCGRR